VQELFIACDDLEPVAFDAHGLEVVVFSKPAAAEAAANQDAAGLWAPDDSRLVVAVADGMGGGAGGGEAAAEAIRALDASIAKAAGGGSARAEIVDAFERANERVLGQGVGAGTTLVVVEIDGDGVRSFHAGDSGALLVGQRGRVRMETLHHSPTGYAIASGMLDREDSHTHRDRHFLSNCIGSADMRIDIGPRVLMAPRDTLLLASDGVLDNVRHESVIECIRKGPLLAGARALCSQARAAMRGEQPDLPAHPDDATAILVRRRARRSEQGA
jgi:serine/threonine protein phosphatase PrpC